MTDQRLHCVDGYSRTNWEMTGEMVLDGVLEHVESVRWIDRDKGKRS